jgi:hypothetical protein
MYLVIRVVTVVSGSMNQKQILAKRRSNDLAKDISRSYVPPVLSVNTININSIPDAESYPGQILVCRVDRW